MKTLKLTWWKLLTIALLFYTFVAGLLGKVPSRPILDETIRALYFHVPMWFGMIIIFTISVVYSIKYLRNNREGDDLVAVEFANTGITFGILGITTGMLWATFAWGSPWNGDPRQNTAAICLLIYFAYFVLRGSLQDEQQKARISAVYNIFAYATMVPLMFILPRLTDSLHPGAGGNPGFNSYDLDGNMRNVFYPAVVGWSLLGVWMATIRVRYRKLKNASIELF